ncbi:MAG: CHASE3 domain-containing protein [Hyphomonadaceae bacterium]|nr:CHASE3 domain-containing protein [Hyphomonadaceae bacterium]
MTVAILGRRFPAAVTYGVALCAALLLLLLTISAAIVQTTAALALNQQVRESIERRSHYRVVLQRMTDAETAQRGFLITGDTTYLQPLEGAHAEALEHLDALENTQLTIAAAAGVARMRQVLEAKFEELDHTVALRRQGRTREAMAIVQSDSGRELMRDLRVVVEHALDSESNNVVDSLDAADEAARRTLWVIIFAGALMLVVGGLLVVTVRNAMAELRASRDDAEAAHRRALDEIGAREQAESKVRQMQKMEAIGQITGGVAHDFNNMLAVIMSALQLAKRRMDRGQEGAAGFIDSAMEGARRAAALTSRLLAFARRQPLSPTVIDVNRVLGDMSELLRRTLGETVELETVLAGGLWRVHADRHELEQAILNICINARDAMPDGGKLTIESANAYLDEEYARANDDVTAGQYVLIAITDNGSGMSPEVKLKVFEPFFTTKEVGKGTGLGLSHVHGFLKQSGGHVSIYSELGVGTTVKLYLPRTGLAEQSATPAPAESEAPAGDPETIILVVEDDARVRVLSVAALRDLGYTVLHADGGPRALEILAQTPNVALLFTDVVMPEMSGRTLADQARASLPNLKVLYTTGYTQNAIVHNGVVDADARLLLKPYTIADLARKVRAALDN